MSVDPVAHNRVAWDRQVDQGNEWSRPISAETVARARAGDWSVVLIGYQPVDRSWFPANLVGDADATAGWLPAYFATRAVKP